MDTKFIFILLIAVGAVLICLLLRISHNRDTISHQKNTISDLRKAVERHENDFEILSAALRYRYGDDVLYQLASAPPGDHIGSDGLPQSSNTVLGTWGEKYTFYTTNSISGKFHRKRCQHAATAFEINAYSVLSHHLSPCYICKPELPDMTWVKDYFLYKEILENHPHNKRTSKQSSADFIIRLNDEVSEKSKQADSLIEAGILTRLASGAKKSQLLLRSYPIFADFENYSHASNTRLTKALTEPMKFIGPISANCKIKGSQESIYDVSLTSCTCIDFLHTHKPCKHMYRLAIELALLCDQDAIEHSISQTTSLLDTEISARKRILSQLEQEHHVQDRSLARLKEQKKELLKDCRRLLSEKSLTHPWAATQFADLMYARDMDIVDQLLYKKNPATKAADKVAAISKELRTYRELAKSLQYRLQVYETAVPWLEDYTDISPAELVSLATTDTHTDENNDEYDRLKNWLSSQEYSSLPNHEKYQIALDRWKKRKKSNWEAGRDFERYVGYLYESRGYSVTYCGALEGLSDLGRDLIAKKGSQVIIIQCKRWKEQRTIHEKHVFQLYGSIVSYNIDNYGYSTSIGNVGLSAIGVLATTCPISDTARRYADYLCIKIDDSYKSSEVFDYPMIKCNISKTGEHIYHLPFDQQYDRVKISPENGEFFAYTVQEAENAGFRRAFRWHSS